MPRTNLKDRRCWTLATIPDQDDLLVPDGWVSRRFCGKTLTPALGGGDVSGHINLAAPISAAGIRGAIRECWRSVWSSDSANANKSSQEMFEAESYIFGGIAKRNIKHKKFDLIVRQKSCGLKHLMPANFVAPSCKNGRARWSSRNDNDLPMFVLQGAASQPSSPKLKNLFRIKNQLAQFCNQDNGWVCKTLSGFQVKLQNNDVTDVYGNQVNEGCFYRVTLRFQSKPLNFSVQEVEQIPRHESATSLLRKQEQALDNARESKACYQPAALLLHAGWKFELLTMWRKDLAPEIQTQLQTAVRLWASLGGVGARTTRGLGAVELCKAGDTHVLVSKTELESLGFKVAFSNCHDSDAETVWNHVIQQKFKKILQGKRIGRRQGYNRRKPSRSYWPEMAGIRHEIQQGETRTFALKHANVNHPSDMPRGWYGMPREFRAPSEVVAPGKSPQWRRSGTITASLVPSGGTRMKSPLLIRPVWCPVARAYKAMAVVNKHDIEACNNHTLALEAKVTGGNDRGHRLLHCVGNDSVGTLRMTYDCELTGIRKQTGMTSSCNSDLPEPLAIFMDWFRQ